MLSTTHEFLQFSEENAAKMKKIYGEFCSHQKEAVNLFKGLQQNKKFQNFIKVSLRGNVIIIDKMLRKKIHGFYLDLGLKEYSVTHF